MLSGFGAPTLQPNSGENPHVMWRPAMPHDLPYLDDPMDDRPAMSVTDADVEELRALEESLWRSETRFDRDLMESTFADDFYEIGRSGRVHSREDCLGIAQQPIEIVLPLPDFGVRSISRDVVQVTYSSLVTYDGILQKGRRSSIWSKSGGRWRLRFHQGTPFPDEEVSE